MSACFKTLYQPPVDARGAQGRRGYSAVRSASHDFTGRNVYDAARFARDPGRAGLEASATCFFALRRLCFLGSTAASWLVSFTLAVRFNAAAKCFPQVDNVGRLGPLRQ